MTKNQNQLLKTLHRTTQHSRRKTFACESGPWPYLICLPFTIFSAFPPLVIVPMYYNTSRLDLVLFHHLDYTACHGTAVKIVVPPYIHIQLPLAIRRVLESQCLLDSSDLGIHWKAGQCYFLMNHSKLMSIPSHEDKQNAEGNRNVI